MKHANCIHEEGLSRGWKPKPQNCVTDTDYINTFIILKEKKFEMLNQITTHDYATHGKKKRCVEFF